MTYAFNFDTIDDVAIEDEMEEDGATYMKCTREVDSETAKKLLS